MILQWLLWKKLPCHWRWSSLQTSVLPVTKEDLKTVLKKNGWFFSWKRELTRNPNVFRLVINKQPAIIQGLISYEVLQGYLFMPLVEAVPHNFGINKQYPGVLPKLVAFVCKQSYDMGFEGVVSFKSKTKLITHYEDKLGAGLIGRFGEMAVFSCSPGSSPRCCRLLLTPAYRASTKKHLGLLLTIPKYY